MESMEKKSLGSPDEVRTFPKGKLEIVNLNGTAFAKATFQPGWKWSESVKPIAKTHSCQQPHMNVHISGRLHVKMDDGTELDFGPGDVGLIPPGHDAWVVGNESVVIVDINGMKNYAVEK